MSPDKNLVLSQLQAVHTEYFAWEQAHSRDRLQALTSRAPQPPDPLPVFNVPDAVPPQAGPQDETATLFTCYHSAGVSMLRATVVEDVASQFDDSYATYESCTPLTQNVLTGDDPNDMPFLPYADEPGFDANGYISEHDGNAWQNPHRDPETLEIVLETARRLHFMDGMSVEALDATGVLPLTLRTTSVSGAIARGLSSDPIDWPGSTRDIFPPLPDLRAPRADDLRTRLEDQLTLLCPRLDCLAAYCPTHAHEQVKLDPLRSELYRSEVPFVSLRPDAACGPGCALLNPNTRFSELMWSEEEREELRVIMHVSPPCTPCDLAGLCHRPCYEIAAACLHLLRESEALKRPHPPSVKTAPIRSPYCKEYPPEFVPNEPCNHEGLCSAARCACFTNRARCTRACRCAVDCRRRWTGCKCKPTTRRGKRVMPCRTSACPCKDSGRECDPELCVSCDSRCASNDSCANSGIQHGLAKDTEAKLGVFGLGLFLLQDARKGDFVTEYLGELIYEPTFSSRGHVANHRGRSYVFSVNTKLSNDSSYAGNPARFINHAPRGRANCAVKILLVNGDQRIGVYADRDIATGTELLLDYGEEFHFGSETPKRESV